MESLKGTLVLQVDEKEILRQLTKMCKKWQNLWVAGSRQCLAVLSSVFVVVKTQILGKYV